MGHVKTVKSNQAVFRQRVFFVLLVHLGVEPEYLLSPSGPVFTVPPLNNRQNFLVQVFDGRTIESDFALCAIGVGLVVAFEEFGQRLFDKRLLFYIGVLDVRPLQEFAYANIQGIVINNVLYLIQSDGLAANFNSALHIRRARQAYDRVDVPVLIQYADRSPEFFLPISRASISVMNFIQNHSQIRHHGQSFPERIGLFYLL